MGFVASMGREGKARDAEKVLFVSRPDVKSISIMKGKGETCSQTKALFQLLRNRSDCPKPMPRRPHGRKASGTSPQGHASSDPITLRLLVPQHRV